MSTKVNTKILNLFYILPIAVLLLLFYKDGLEVYFNQDDWTDFLHVEASRNTFYLYPWYGVLRPTMYAFLDLQHSLFGLNPLPYHLVILCLHFINSFLVFAIVKKIGGNRLVGFLASLLFATSWLHPDAVVWPHWMMDPLLAFFSMCSMVFFYRNRLNPTWSNYLLSLLAFVMAVGAKEPVAAFLPPLLYLTDRYIALESQDMLPGTALNLSKKVYLPFLLISAAWMTFIILPAFGGAINEARSVLRTLNNLLCSITFCFAFPLFSESPRWGIINLTLVMFFYFFSPAWIKRRLLLLMIAMVIVYLPTSQLLSPAPRFLYLSSVFGTAIFATILYYGGIQLSKKMKLSEGLAKFLVVLYVFLLVYSNYLFVDRQIKYYCRTGNVTRNLLKAVTSTFPRDTLGMHLIFVNFPEGLESKHPLHSRLPLWGGSLSLPLRVRYGSSNVGQVTEVILSAVDGNQGLLGKKISVQEFEELTKDKGNTVYFFNSKDDSIHNVTGKDYNFLKKLASGS